MRRARSPLTRSRGHGRLLSALALAAGATVAAYSADGATPTPQIGRATLLRPEAGAHEEPIGTAVRLSQVSDIDFATSQVGYALGGPQGATFPLKTTNGGRSWVIDGPAFFLPVADGAAAVNALSAPRANAAYAYGGDAAGSTIDSTTDGVRWWRASLGQAIVAAASRPGDIWALAAGSITSSTGSAVPPMLLYDSSDGGRSWRYRSTLTGVLGWQADLVRPSVDTAFAVVKAFRSDSASRGGIVETTDAGRTWTRRKDPCQSRFSGQVVDWTERLVAPTATSLWLFCGGEPGAGLQTKLVERSSDAGRRWTLVASNAPGEHVPPHAIPLEGTLPDTGVTNDLTATSPSDAWLILIGNDALWKTIDGGHTWTPGVPSGIAAQFPQEFSLAQGTMFLKTQNALWASSAGRWKLLAGTREPY